VFGEVTTGASNDLQKVAEITHAMTHEYAMSSSATGQRAWIDLQVASEHSRRLRDEEQRELAFEGERIAHDLLTLHRIRLDALAGALLERELLERSDLDEILGDVPRPERRGDVGLRVVAADPKPLRRD
jgi:cell division protease FtsH